MAGVWRRMGIVCGAPDAHPWWRTHAQLPTALPLRDDLWRIFFSARDADNRSSMLAVDVDPSADMAVRAEHFEVLFERGPLGAFDHAGIVTSQVTPAPEGVRLYYTGLVERRDVRTGAALGLAHSADGLRFERPFPGPVFSQGPHDPYFTAAPMLHDADGEQRLYFISGVGWDHAAGAMEPYYGIRMLRSADGRAFGHDSEAVFGDGIAPALSFGRPWVAAMNGRQRLWFSLRGIDFRENGSQAYRIASCLLDERGLAAGPIEPAVFANPPQDGDFDSWMQAYACVLPHRDRLYMLYNGDGFGAAGFGWAMLEDGGQPAR